ncbi:MAG TPA: hypothetical protein VGF23_21930 [Gaiellaceae bacterium]|jgi:hypothetical protein
MAATAAELLLAGQETHVVEIPPDVLRPAGESDDAEQAGPARVVVRPLLLVDVQRIQQAAQDSQALSSVLMVQQALVEPRLSIDEVNRMHVGLVEYLLREVNRISGLALSGDELEELVHAPLARACFVLAREFGWTPDECSRLSLGQVLVYLEMLGRGEGTWTAPV